MIQAGTRQRRRLAMEEIHSWSKKAQQATVLFDRHKPSVETFHACHSVRHLSMFTAGIYVIYVYKFQNV
ncbi:hypothetical protein SAMN02745166_04577 [Prosthecobacter debontii]|uniref:Uncharacterized protein n=1 Tax=Prosthecobacter debontii TaxID=48467 RepID=A0A1T4YZB2_9BACT|nr:hypothetical protein SAMN02745166_04577 [Prosthecobacter debontii]